MLLSLIIIEIFLIDARITFKFVLVPLESRFFQSIKILSLHI